MTHPISDNGKDTDSVSPDSLQRPPLIGRDQELTRVETILEQGLPAVVVVSADTGMGKSSLLREIHARVTARGWRTTHGESGDNLSVEPTATEDTFRQLVLTLLDSSTEGSYFDSMTGRSRVAPAPSLVYQLSRRAPILLIIDGYRPDPPFARWFTESFIEDVKHAMEPIVIVVADQSANLAELERHADEVINLGPLDQQAVKRFLESASRRIDPPMQEEELDTYVEAARKDPVRLAILARLLTLAQQAEPGTDPPVSA